MKVAGASITVEQMLLASIVDNTRIAAWLQSSDGATGVNKPVSILAKLLNEESDKDVVGFASRQDFDDEWKRLTTGGI